MVAASSSPAHEANHNFVNVEFDDGDSGKIHVDDIRLLPPEFPVLGECMLEILLFLVLLIRWSKYDQLHIGKIIELWNTTISSFLFFFMVLHISWLIFYDGFNR